MKVIDEGMMLDDFMSAVWIALEDAYEGEGKHDPETEPEKVIADVIMQGVRSVYDHGVDGEYERERPDCDWGIPDGIEYVET